MKTAFWVGAVVALIVARPVAVSAEGEEGGAERSLYESPTPPQIVNEIDRVVFDRLKTLGIEPALCSDAVFVRRVHLDVIGALPTAAEARAFLDDPAPDKRAALIDRLLERDEFADYWAMKWADVLRIKAEFPINLWPNAAQAYHRWVRASIAANEPFDAFARALLTSSGSNFRVGPVNFYRAVQNRTPEGLAAAAALTFMGARVDSWPAERLAGMAAFFSQVGYKPTREWKEEIVFWDPYRVGAAAQDRASARASAEAAQPLIAAAAFRVEIEAAPPPRLEPIEATFPDGASVVVGPDQDPREVFADWLIRPENPWFTQAVANRLWSWLMGRGVVHEPDDFRDDNPPGCPELLACLEAEMASSGYDVKRYLRLILNSSTYQFSSLPRPGVDRAAAEAAFACYAVRRLDAEVLIDAVNAITGATDLYTSPIPEPFTYIPQDQTAVSIADGSITSGFLTMFGRSARATGMENERSNKPLPAQWLHMLNSSHIQRKLEQGPKLKTIFDFTRKPVEIVEDLYLTVLSRRPTDAELEAVMQYVKATPSRRDAAVDLTWALINNPEFLYRH